MVYPTLTLLDDMGLIDEQKAEGAKKLFAITEAGKAHLAEQPEEVEALFARLAEVGDDARATERRADPPRDGQSPPGAPAPADAATMST